ncbi:MAG: L,D-transpeptidase family protein [Hyphomonadaceae bacterium]|nr:L,D-transpeptidase family protein [Hyphomonadaceae bacterium]
MALLVLASCAGGGEAPPTEPVPAPPARVWDDRAVDGLRIAIAGAEAEGLPPESAALEELNRLQRRAQHDAGAAARLDATAETLFARLAHALAQGGVDPESADPEWHMPRAPAPDIEALRAELRGGAAASAVLSALAPASADYRTLVSALAQVRAEPEGALDANGLARETRIDLLRATLERWRWLPRDLPPRRIDVLIPFFQLRVRDGAAAPIEHAVIVGARRTPTPSFAAQIETVTLNPYWTPPSSILNAELLPRFRRDPAAAARENYEAVNAQGAVVSLADVDWNARPFAYTLRQRPGAGNALGRLRFDLPNPYAVFLHDTSSRSLFERADRALSHGCVRVAQPEALAVAVLGGDWTAESLEAAIESGETQLIQVAPALPVYLLYLTATVTDSGVVFAEDIYGRDARLLRALDGGAQGSRAGDDSETECASS